MAAMPRTNRKIFSAICRRETVRPFWRASRFSAMPLFASRRLLQIYTPKMTNRVRPGSVFSAPPRLRTSSSAAPKTISRAFSWNWERLTAEGMHTRDSPRMSPRLAVTEPTALPTARSTSPWRVPVRETVSSGRVVARETMVAPMMNRGTPVASAIHTAPSRNQSPPLMIRSRPSKNNSTVIQISILSTAFQKFSETSIPQGNAGNPAVVPRDKSLAFQRARAAENRRRDDEPRHV